MKILLIIVAFITLSVVKCPTLCQMRYTKESLAARLSPTAILVTRNQGYEEKFSGPYRNNKLDGIYRCIVCTKRVFESKHQLYGDQYPYVTFNKAMWCASRYKFPTPNKKILGVKCISCNSHLGDYYDEKWPASYSVGNYNPFQRLGIFISTFGFLKVPKHRYNIMSAAVYFDETKIEPVPGVAGATVEDIPAIPETILEETPAIPEANIEIPAIPDFVPVDTPVEFLE